MPTETVEDIVREMRSKACLAWIRRRLKRDEELRTFADRIEAAHKLEMEKHDFLAALSISEGYEAAHKKEFAELKGRLDAIVEYADNNNWSSGFTKNECINTCQKVHNYDMNKIKCIAKGASK